MLNLIARFFALMIGLWLSDLLFAAVTIDSIQTMALAALVLLGINVIIKPILRFLTIPINILTLGIFGAVLNVALFWFGQSLVDGFTITGTWGVVLAAIVTLFIYNLAGRDDRD